MNIFGLTGIGTWIILLILFGVMFYINYKSYQTPNNPAKSKSIWSMIVATLGILFVIASFVGLVFFQTNPATSTVRRFLSTTGTQI